MKTSDGLAPWWRVTGTLWMAGGRTMKSWRELRALTRDSAMARAKTTTFTPTDAERIDRP